MAVPSGPRTFAPKLFVHQALGALPGASSSQGRELVSPELGLPCDRVWLQARLACSMGGTNTQHTHPAHPALRVSRSPLLSCSPTSSLEAACCLFAWLHLLQCVAAWPTIHSSCASSPACLQGFVAKANAKTCTFFIYDSQPQDSKIKVNARSFLKGQEFPAWLIEGEYVCITGRLTLPKQTPTTSAVTTTTNTTSQPQGAPYVVAHKVGRVMDVCVCVLCMCVCVCLRVLCGVSCGSSGSIIWKEWCEHTKYMFVTTVCVCVETHQLSTARGVGFQAFCNTVRCNSVQAFEVGAGPPSPVLGCTHGQLATHARACPRLTVLPRPNIGFVGHPVRWRGGARWPVEAGAAPPAHARVPQAAAGPAAGTTLHSARKP